MNIYESSEMKSNLKLPAQKKSHVFGNSLSYFFAASHPAASVAQPVWILDSHFVTFFLLFRDISNCGHKSTKKSEREKKFLLFLFHYFADNMQ